MPEVRYLSTWDAKLLDAPNGKVEKKHLLFGDWVSVEEELADGWARVHVRGEDGFLRQEQLREERILEVVFVDIGQGDGTFLVTPDDEKIVIDAGEGKNMAWFLKWRFRDFRRPTQFDAAVITHSDADHYGGFQALFDINNLKFDRLYLNGLIERAGSDLLGDPVSFSGKKYHTDIVFTHQELLDKLKSKDFRGAKKYPNMLWKASNSGRFGSYELAALKPDGQGAYKPDESTFSWVKGVKISILGPVLEDVDGRLGYRRFAGDDGKTKNGHSIVLMLEYGQVRMLLGGDLNVPSENLLLEKHTGMRSPAPADMEEQLIQRAQQVFLCDVAKSCHHGSADVSDVFLKALRPVATVISSGDNESHAHPRPETLGVLGRHSRGPRPLIFSTELMRSSREQLDLKLIDELFELRKEREQLPNGDPGIPALEKKIDDLEYRIGRGVVTYGAIQLRTDGKRVLMAYRLEVARSGNAGGKKTKTEWDIYRLEPDPSGRLAYVPKEH